MKTVYLQPPLIHHAQVQWMRIILMTAFFILCSLRAQTQIDSTGFIKVTLTDKKSRESIPFANITAYQKGVQIALNTTNIDGECRFTLQPGEYDLKAIYVGYQPSQVNKVLVRAAKTTFITMSLDGGVELQEVEIVTYQVPLADPDTKSGSTITREDYQYMAVKTVNSVAATGAGIHVRGGRSGNTSHYIDGLSVSGSPYPNNGEGYEESNENRFKKCKQDPLSTFSSDVDVASYANLRRIINDGYLPPKEAIRIEEMVNYFRPSYSQPLNNNAFAIHSEISTCPWNQKHRLLQVGIQGKEIEMENTKPNHLTFLIDVSGSMDSPDKLPLLKNALSMLVKQLRDEDRVAMVVYAGNAGLVLPSTGGDKKQKILEAIDQLDAGGSTAGGEGIVLAYKVAKDNFSANANNRVILATDGDFNVGISNDNELIKLIEEKRDDGIFLTVLGFGTGNYQEAKMEKLADKGNGNFAYVDNLLEAKKVLVKEMGGTLVTIAKDVKIQVEFNSAFVRSYRLIGYDNRMLAHEDFKNDKKDAGDVGSGHSVTAFYEIVPADSKEEEDSVDDFKYQERQNTIASQSNEICTVKLRYKEPMESTSKEISETIHEQQKVFENASENFRFSAAVIELGLILRRSDYKAKSNYNDLIRMAKAAKGEDEDGYKAEFIRLCEMAETIASK